MSKQGEFIKTVRRKQGLTQKQLAEKLNVSDKVISKWEVGDSFPDYTLLPELAKILQVEIQEILDGECHKKEQVKKESDSKTIEKNNTNNYVFVTNVNSNDNKKGIGNEESLDKVLGLESKPSIKNLKCQSCGSSDIMLNGDYGICNSCGTKIILDKNITNNFITNVSLKNEDLQNHYIIDTLINEKDFKKSVYYFLTTQRTPADILDNTTFKKIEKNDAQFLTIDARYNGNYSASIGYDRKEQYIAQEKVYDPEIKDYIVKNVTKERTVTDWRPVSGPVSTSQKSCVQLGIGGKDALDRLTDSLAEDVDYLQAKGNIKPINPENSKNINFYIPTQKEINKAISSGECKVYAQTKSSLYGTGDHMKDFNCSLNHSIERQNFYVATEYSIGYVYHDNQAGEDLEGMAWGLGYKNDVIGIYPDASEDIDDQIKSQTKGSGIFSLFTSILTILFCVLSLAILQEKKFLIVIGILFFASMISFIHYRKKYKKIKTQVNTDIMERKKQKLIDRLQKEGLPALTNKELKEIEKIKEAM